MRGLRLGLGLGLRKAGLNNTHAYRYYRLNGTNSITANIGIDEFQIAATPGGANTAVGQTATANTTSSGAASNVNDNVIGAGPYWVSTGLPGIVTIDYGATAGNWIAANQFKIIARNDAAFTQSPSAFTIDGSDNNSTWTTLVNQSGLTWSQAETKTFTV